MSHSHNSMVRNSPKNRTELITDVWARVADILLEQKLDKTAVALGSTSTELHHLVLPKLYDTVRISNYKALMLFIYGCDESPYKPPPPVRVLDARTLTRHVEIECEPDFDDFHDIWDLPHPLHRIVSCHVRTTEVKDDTEAKDGYLDFLVLVMRQIPSEYVRWEHSGRHDELLWVPTRSSKRAKALRDPKIKSLELPYTWQLIYDDRDATPVLYNARTLGHMLTNFWYTNPNGNETAGDVFKRLSDERRVSGSVAKKPMYIVQISQEETPKSRSVRDDWREKQIDRQTSGTLTDFAVMEKMGLIDVKIVSLPDRWEAEKWRRWIVSDGLKPGNGVQADLRAIAE